MLVALRNALLFLLTTMDLYLVFLLEQPGNSEFRYVALELFLVGFRLGTRMVLVLIAVIFTRIKYNGHI